MAYKSKGKKKKQSFTSSSSDSETSSISPQNMFAGCSYRNGIESSNQQQNPEIDSQKHTMSKSNEKRSIEGSLNIGLAKAGSGSSRKIKLKIQKPIFCSKKIDCGDSGGFNFKERNWLPRRKIAKRRKGTALSIRRSTRVADRETVNSNGKRTVLSWLIDSGIISLNSKISCMNCLCTRVLLEGKITRDGILCTCCNRVITVAEFNSHAATDFCEPRREIVMESGISLLQCQINAWDQQKELAHCGFQIVSCQNGGDDPYDDACGICADGGDLLCCDLCPSTFHHSCLGMQMIPEGVWHCPNCLCKFCEVAGCSPSQLLTCCQCEKKYHKECNREIHTLFLDINRQCASFCGKNCREISDHLNMLMGVRNEIESGFSWTLIRRLDQYSSAYLRAVCHSKLAVALTVMEECFNPILDRGSGIDMLKSIVYNYGSNFNRLNFSGFYTVVLERGDEIISAASIRIHGTTLAEMPLIGTRKIYRRQGMCHRLLNEIQRALCFFKVEKLIIPSTRERVNKWTKGFGFKTIEESQKTKLRSVNTLAFHKSIQLQKILLNCDSAKGAATGRGTSQGYGWMPGFGFRTIEEFLDLDWKMRNGMVFPNSSLSHKTLTNCNLAQENVAASGDLNLCERSNSRPDRLGAANNSITAIPLNLNLEPSDDVEVDNTETNAEKRSHIG